ncbi:MAG: MFS transporter [Candidatus Auribacterota bacterium]|nr:MFS transporter [Candidatus Auribacterota bacterium]
MTGTTAHSHQAGGRQTIRLIGIFIWLIAAFFFLYEFFLRTFLGSLEPQIMKALHLNAETFSILGSSYYLVYGLMQIPVGIIIDRVGVKLTMVTAAILCGLSAICFALSGSFAFALASRLLMGFGSSFAFICLLTIARDWFPRSRFGFFAGLSQFIGTLGPILAGGPLVIFLEKEQVSWQTMLFVLGLVGFVISLLSFFFVRGRKAGPNRMILLPPRIPLKEQLLALVSNKQAWWVAVFSALIYTSIATLGAIWGTRVLIAKGLHQDLAAEVISVLWIGYAISCPLTGYLSDIFQRRKVFMVGMAAMVLVSIAGLRFFPSGSAGLFGVVFFVLGFAGGAQNLGFATIVEKVSERLSSTSMGMNNGLMLTVDTINPMIFAFLVTLTLANKNAEDFSSHNFDYALSYILGLGIVALLVSIFCIKETYCKPQRDLIMVEQS